MNALSNRQNWRVTAQEYVRRAKSMFVVLAACLLQIFSVTAFAHASLIASQPPESSVLRTAPATAVLRFNEPVAPLVFKLVSPDGSIKPLNQIAVIPDGLNIAFPRTEAAGTYMLSWRVISADGHPVGGALSYSVGSPSSGAKPIASSSSPALIAVIWLARFGLYVSLFLGIGGVAFRAFFSSDIEESPRWINALIFSSWLLLPAAVGTHGLDALSASWDQLLSWEPWKTSLGTAYGMTAVLMLAASLVAYAGNARKKAATGASVVALVLLGISLASSGHAASAPPTWLARPTVFLHAVGISLWIGSLGPLMSVLGTMQGPQILRNFSRTIPWILVILLATGIMLATLQLRHLNELWLSDYGKVLCAKLVLLSALLVVAAFNRYVLTARVEKGNHRAARKMKQLITVEIILVLMILAAATTWRFTPPPRALAPSLSVASHVHIHTAEAMADVTLIPRGGRQVEAQVFLANGEGVPLKAKEVVLKFSSPQQGLEPLEEETQLGENETWKTRPFVLPATQGWQVLVKVLISDFESINLEGTID